MSANGFGLIIVAHGQLAHQYLATLQHVIGQQTRIVAVSIDDLDDRSQKRLDIEKLAQELDNGTGVVIATDMFGGTPSNLALRCLETKSYRMFYGVNMPALVKLARSRHLPIDDALQAAVTAGHKYLNFVQGTDQ